MVGDYFFTCDSIWLAEHMRGAPGKVYVFYFDQPSRSARTLISNDEVDLLTAFSSNLYSYVHLFLFHSLAGYSWKVSTEIFCIRLGVTAISVQIHGPNGPVLCTDMRLNMYLVCQYITRLLDIHTRKGFLASESWSIGQILRTMGSFLFPSG